MATVVDPLVVAKELLSASVGARATRHVAATVAAALFRSVIAVAGGPTADWCEDPVADEVNQRLHAIKPVLDSRVRGCNSSGAVRARRNVAEHNFEVKMRDVTLHS